MSKPKKPFRSLFASTETPKKNISNSNEKVQASLPKPARRVIEEQAIIEEQAKVEEIEIFEEKEITQKNEVQEQLEAVIVTHPATTLEVSNEERILQIQYNFDSMRPAREAWQEQDYAQFLKRLDAIQTEAFLLKGKLLSEMKVRFFETNKVGWAEFCEQALHMNYTTANQYIRVATEFDVTSHQMPDFGFEHFKALLPLPVEDRIQFLQPGQSLSVKVIRTRVKEILSARNLITPSSQQIPSNAQRQSVRLIRMLEQIKSEVLAHGESFETLAQTQRWQISAACQNIAAHLNQLSQLLNAEPRPMNSSRQSDLRSGASITIESV